MINMAANENISHTDPAALEIVRYPDLRLRRTCQKVTELNDELRRVVDRMFSLMGQANGVGLAAPQVGLAVCLFVASPTASPDDRRVYINPCLAGQEGSQDGQEGCLSFPGIYCRIKRYARTTIEATDLAGRRFQETGEGLAARIFQHEIEHLDGRLLVDRMGSVARLANRKALQELEQQAASKA